MKVIKSVDFGVYFFVNAIQVGIENPFQVSVHPLSLISLNII